MACFIAVVSKPSEVEPGTSPISLCPTPTMA
jgi:hypothetical protein